MTRVNVILARAANGVIGAKGSLPWHLPEDMAHFKAQTAGAPVIMGRKTWDSLPPRFRPLPGRQNIVVSRQPDWQAAGALATSTLQEAIALCGDAPEAWVIGGAQVYAETLSKGLAQRAVITEIDQDFEGDAFAPTFDAQMWRETARAAQVSANGLAFSFVTLERLPPAG